MRRYGLFQFGPLKYAISLVQIRKILQDSATYALPRLPRAVAAVLLDDGELVPLLDLGKLIGDSQPGQQKTGYQVLVITEYGNVALPAELTGKIVTEQKGKWSAALKENDSWAVGEFQYQDNHYKILDIDFLAIEMTQGFWQNSPDTGGARRLNEEETAVSR